MSLPCISLPFKGSKKLFSHYCLPLSLSFYSSQITRPLPKINPVASHSGGGGGHSYGAHFNASAKGSKTTLMSPSIFQKYKELVGKNTKASSGHVQPKEGDALFSTTEPVHEPSLSYVLSSANRRRLTWKEKENLPDRPELSLVSRFSIGSPQKLNEIGRQIAKLTLAQAIVQMQFSPKRAAVKVLSTLLLLKAKAEAMPYMTPDLLSRMTIHAATVGRGKILKRLDIKARGRTGIRHRIYSQIRITLKEPNLATIYRKKYKFHIRKEHKPVYFKLNY